jgi:hypothetical protein
MTIQQAIILGAVIIAVSIIGARVMAPYKMAGDTSIVWRINTVTGTVEPCNYSIDVSKAVAGNPRCR